MIGATKKQNDTVTASSMAIVVELLTFLGGERRKRVIESLP